jgi:predicted RNA-binding protein YlqC (UPF0109 family)
VLLQAHIVIVLAGFNLQMEAQYGREGRTAQAMRTLLSAAAAAKGIRATLEIAA